MKALFTLIAGFSLALTSLAGPTNKTTTASSENFTTRTYSINAETFVRRLRIYPHAFRGANAYYSPEKKALLLGYFPAAAGARGAQLLDRRRLRTFRRHAHDPDHRPERDSHQ